MVEMDQTVVLQEVLLAVVAEEVRALAQRSGAGASVKLTIEQGALLVVVLVALVAIGAVSVRKLGREVRALQMPALTNRMLRQVDEFLRECDVHGAPGVVRAHLADDLRSEK